MTVRTRYAPSPTGALHIGNVRSGLFAYLFARHNHGAFILRIDDTDEARSTTESLEEILESLRWLGVEWDEGPPDRKYFQSSRFDRYRESALKLLRENKAYPCYCTAEELDAMRKAAERENDEGRACQRAFDRRNPVVVSGAHERGDQAVQRSCGQREQDGRPRAIHD